MAAVCDVCGKGPGFGKSVSHSHVRTNRRWNPNIQRVRALVNGTPKRLNVCTKCLTRPPAGRKTPPRRGGGGAFVIPTSWCVRADQCALCGW